MRYTEEQAEWIRINASAKVWGNAHAFADAFNETFGEERTASALLCYMQRRKIQFVSEGRFTSEQRKWIEENVRAIEWRNIKHFADTFNAIFGTKKDKNTMASYLSKKGLQIRTRHTTDNYTDKMNEWIVENFDKYDCDFVSLAEDFNKEFGTDYSNCRLAKHCQRRLKIHTPTEKKKHSECKRTSDRRPRISKPFTNKGQFKKGRIPNTGLPVGTIRHNSDGRPYIKVLESDGRSGQLSDYKGHNYKEPWWKPLQKKIWEDHYGEVPEGYQVISLNGDQNDTDIRNIGIIDKRGKAVMSKKGWWTDNTVITGDGVQWCNLYYTAKDNGVYGTKE